MASTSPSTLMIVLFFSWEHLNNNQSEKNQRRHHLQPQITEHDVCKLLITVCAAVDFDVLCEPHENTVLCLQMRREAGGARAEPVSPALCGRPVRSTRSGIGAPPTLQSLGPVLLDHDAELQDQLRRRLQERLQQPQHVDVGVLEHHGPVPAPLVLLLPARHDAQIQRPDVPVGGQT